MNRVVFEGRFLVNMISTMLGKAEFQIRYGRMDWERLFRVSDYNRVANMVYLGLIGNGGSVPQRWQDRFFERYQDALLYGQSCEEDEKEILALLDMENVPCIVLASTTVRKMYELPETADMSPLRLYLSPEGYSLAKGYLVDLGYETVKTYPGCGERMRRLPGLNVDIYHTFPFKTHYYEKGMRDLMMHAKIRDGGTAVRILPMEDRFVFRMASVAYQYVEDELLIRDLLDLFLYHRIQRRQLNEPYIKLKLQDLHVDVLAEKLLRLSYMWFGTRTDKKYLQLRAEDQPEDLREFDVLENRILRRGDFDKEKEVDSQAIALARLLVKEEEREMKKLRKQSFQKKVGEWKKSVWRGLRWVFPGSQYMSALYPSLEKVPVLLPVYWLRRGIRLLVQMVLKRNQQY